MIITRNSTRLFVFISYIIMVVVNALANIIPINGVTTGQVAASYPNLFTPAAYTFSIWSLIYLLLGGYTLYQLGFFGENKVDNQENYYWIRIYFIISCFANASWIFAWHYFYILLSLSFMIMLLVCLIRINQMVNEKELIKKERLFMRLPFSVYFGWITIATIANVTTYLVSIGWDGFGIPEEVWTIIVLILGLIIGASVMVRYQDLVYGLVLIWAYMGILIRHISETGFVGQYPQIIRTLIISIILIIALEVYLIFKINKQEID